MPKTFRKTFIEEHRIIDALYKDGYLVVDTLSKEDLGTAYVCEFKAKEKKGSGSSVLIRVVRMDPNHITKRDISDVLSSRRTCTYSRRDDSKFTINWLSRDRQGHQPSIILTTSDTGVPLYYIVQRDPDDEEETSRRRRAISPHYDDDDDDDEEETSYHEDDKKLTEKEVIGIFQRLGFNVYSWLETDKTSSKAYIYDFEASHSRYGHVFIRATELSPEECTPELASLALRWRKGRTYKKPNGQEFTIDWWNPAPSIHTVTIKEKSKPLYFIMKYVREEKITERDVIAAFQDMDYYIDFWLGFRDKTYGDAHIYEFEASHKDIGHVLIRAVGMDNPNYTMDDVNRMLYRQPTCTYDLKNGQECTVSWSSPKRSTQIAKIAGKSKPLYYIMQSIKVDPTGADDEETSYHDEDDDKEELAKKYLRDNHYSEIVKLGKGSFGIVFSCINPQRKKVAAKVVISTDRKTVESEISSGAYVANISPIDVNVLAGLKRAPQFSDARFTDRFLEQKRIFENYINVPAVKRIFADGPYYIAILEAPLMDKDLSELRLPSVKSGSFDKINHKEIKKIMSAALSTINLMKKRNLVHLDIKPANILSRQLGEETKTIRYAVSDYGMATPIRFPKDPKKTDFEALRDNIGAMCTSKAGGTPLYMSPEVKKLFGFSGFTPDATIKKGIDILNKISRNRQLQSEDIVRLSPSDRAVLEKTLEKLEDIGPKSDIYSLGITILDIIQNQYLPDLREIIISCAYSEPAAKQLPDKIFEFCKKNSSSLSTNDKILLCKIIASLMVQFDIKDRAMPNDILKNSYFT